MNEILIVAGLGVLTLLAEIFSFKKFIAPIVIAGLLATWVVAALELNGDIYSSLNKYLHLTPKFCSPTYHYCFALGNHQL